MNEQFVSHDKHECHKADAYSKVLDMSTGWNCVDADTTTGVNKGEEASDSYTSHWNFGVCSAQRVILVIHGENYKDD